MYIYIERKLYVEKITYGKKKSSSYIVDFIYVCVCIYIPIQKDERKQRECNDGIL